jgi:hypothetical protein
VRFYQGRLGEAHALMGRFVADPWGRSERRPPNGWPLPNDALAAVMAHLVVTTWIHGDHEASRELGERALERAASLEFPFRPFTTGYVKSQLAVLRRLEGDHAAAAQLADEMIELGDRHGFVMWSLAGFIQRGISQVHLGDAAALGPLVGTIGAWRGVLSAEVYTPYWLTELAAAQLAAGLPDDARAALDEALEVAAATGSEHYSAETLRIRGVLRCEAGDRGGLDDLEAAVQLAHGQSARAFELRAAEALAHAARPLAAG